MLMPAQPVGIHVVVPIGEVKRRIQLFTRARYACFSIANNRR